MEVSGNNYVDQSVFINQIVGNELFHKAGKFDSITVAAKSPNYVNTVQQEITNLYGSNNLGVITPIAILQTRMQFQSGTSTFALEIAFIAVGIITSLYTSVNDRVSEIGTMKAKESIHTGAVHVRSAPDWSPRCKIWHTDRNWWCMCANRHITSLTSRRR